MKTLKINLFLFVLLLVIGFTAARAQTTYNRAGQWQKEVDAFLEADKKEFPPKDAVLFYGSSSFRLWKDSAQVFPNFKTINRGFGGTQFEDAIFFAKDIALPYKPKVILLYEGDNDLASGKTVEQVFNDYKTLVALIHKSLPKTRIIFVAIKPSPSRRNLWEQDRQVNALVKADTEKDKRLAIVDTWDEMLTKDGQPRDELFVEDRLHMKPEGYEIWRKALTPVIAKALKGNFR
jgi:lysophospholipase L1-like esterase